MRQRRDTLIEADQGSTSAVVTCIDEQMEQWTAAKVGGGNYLEVLVREFVASVRELESPGGNDRRRAAEILLQLDSTPIFFTAESYTSFKPRPELRKPKETRAFMHEELLRWVELNELQSRLYHVDSTEFDDVSHTLVRFASERGTEDRDRAARIWVKRKRSSGKEDSDLDRGEYQADMCVLQRFHIASTVSEGTGLWPDAWRTMTALTSAIRSFVASLPEPAQREDFIAEWRDSWPDLKSEIDHTTICPSGSKLLNDIASSDGWSRLSWSPSLESRKRRREDELLDGPHPSFKRR
jgi:hypothetical protein